MYLPVGAIAHYPERGIALPTKVSYWGKRQAHEIAGE
jgi:hypothetical protein